ncbi:proton-conducting transporter transmembrane domain-containing protein [Sulfuracidifex tepidarius]|uniref:F(420)H(2) dehydrogenase subunit L n=1 Tax=Sulfuracidifex tepidarius TaxID=1294262 RepID=A0A510E3F4_9CREN|nr:proton-conducting transporter membrane subunit [Sulfuracidifex tepidarius]BBG27016.1 F(420)H(2) dehydrogenase subunit L [Sulfuracidifex tepidarius]
MLGFIILIISLVLASSILLVKDKKIASIVSGVSIALNVYFLFKYGLFETFSVGSYIGNFGLVVNDLNFPFIVTILVVTLATVPYSLRYMKHKFEGSESWGLYYGMFTLFAVSMLYVVLSTNLLELYIFLEVALVTSFVLIAVYGYGDRKRISLMYFIWTHVGTILLLASIIIIGLESGRMDIYSSYDTLYSYSSVNFAYLLFVIAVVGMFVKGAMAGFNVWLPYAHGEAPTPVSVLLSPNMVGLGVFVVIIYYYLFPSMSLLAPVFIGWALITMIYGGINAISQSDFKRFLAYSSVSQMGYMLLGASISFLLGLSNNVSFLPIGILASVLIYVSHGLGKALLFMSAGASITEIENRNINELGGLFKTSPLHTTLSFIGILNILGLPPSVGLISEALLIFAAGETYNVIGVGWFVTLLLLLFIAIAISSAYGGLLFKKVYSGIKRAKEIDGAKEYSIPMFVIAFISVLLFFFPQLTDLSFYNFIQGIGSNSVLLPLVVFIPALGSLIALSTPRSLNQDIRGAINVVTIGLSMVFSLYFLVRNLGNPLFYSPSFTFSLGYLQFSTTLLQSILAIFVAGLSFFISIYSVGYMKEDSVLRRYWGFFGIFVSFMLMAVLSDNVFTLVAGWEGTSLASYGLISYWLDDNDKNVVGDFGRKVLGIPFLSRPTVSGIRALIFTRAADVGFLMGLGYLMYVATGNQNGGISLLFNSFDGRSITEAITTISSMPYVWVIFLVLFLGGLSKSAQFPFTQWLLTAMTGPTPVSSLIHAATMVNLGAILSFLLFPYMKFTVYSSPFFYIVASLAIFTAIYTSVNALVSREQKVILANSTADQISLMLFSSSVGVVLGVPTVGIVVGLIQMFAHGLYKASLFMNAGSVIHFTENRYIQSYPQLYKVLTPVFVLQLIAALNLANIPPLAGFWAHDFIGNLASSSTFFGFYVIIEFLGSLYILRYIIKTFFWKGSEHEAHGHKVNSLMIIAPAFLVLGSIILGLGVSNVVSYFSSVTNVQSYTYIDFIGLGISLLGIALSTVYVREFSTRSISPLIDFAYYGWMVYPIFDLIGYGYSSFASGVYRYVEKGVLDRGINEMIPSLVVGLGSRVYKGVQNGVLSNYVSLYTWGIAVLLVLLLLYLGVVG